MLNQCFIKKEICIKSLFIYLLIISFSIYLVVYNVLHFNYYSNITLFILMIFIYLYLLRKITGCWDIYDVRLWFVVLFLMYGIAEPFIKKYNDIDNLLIETTFIYLIGTLGFVISFFFNIPRKNIRNIDLNLNFLKSLRLVSIGGILLGLIFFLYYFKRIGIINAIIIPKPIVLDQLSTISISNIDLPFLPLLIVSLNGYFFTLVHWPRRNSKVALGSFIFITITIVFFWILFGSRRSIFFLFISLVGVFATKKKVKISLIKFLMIFFIVGILFSLFDFFRFTTLIKGGKILIYKLQIKEILSEFINPYGTLILTVKNNITFKNGETYVQAFLNIIPRSLYPGEKPLVIEKAWRSTHIPQLFPPERERIPGLGFLPITEAYLNFGLLGPPFIMFIIGILLNLVSIIRYSKSIYLKLLYGPLFIQVFNLNRACFATVLNSFLYVGYNVFYVWASTIIKGINNKKIDLVLKVRDLS